MDRYFVTCFYRFVPLSKVGLEHHKAILEQLAKDTKLRGLILIAEEGINGTVAGQEAAVNALKDLLYDRFELDESYFKDSTCGRPPFRSFRVKIKPEIVAIGDCELVPERRHHRHLSPAEWNRVLREEEVLLLDVRNSYETKVGKFEGAREPDLDSFRQFSDYVAKSGIPKDQKVLMYCTGGIRCEKAILEMERQGYQNVYQLDGGILRYLEECPNQAYQGECFVFDYRVALDQRLAPTVRYDLCPHCGDPGEVQIRCRQCGESAVVCDCCQRQNDGETCSKNCRYHYGRTER